MEYQWRDIHADSSLESSLSSSDEAESVISSAAPFDDDDNSGREQEGDTERDGSFNDIDIEDELDEEELENLTTFLAAVVGILVWTFWTCVVSFLFGIAPFYLLVACSPLLEE